MAEEENREWNIKSEAELATSRAARGRGGPSKFYRSDARRRRQLAGHRAQTFLYEDVDMKKTHDKKSKRISTVYI